MTNLQNPPKLRLVSPPEPLREELLLELARLRQEVEQLRMEKDDLEIVLETTTQHADTIQEELQKSYQEIARLNCKLEGANKELEKLANSDGLTGLANRRRFDEYLRVSWQDLSRSGNPLSLILSDLDFFKPYNDTKGHQAGDDCLKRVAAALAGAVKRPHDLVARYGGEELAVILPGTGTPGARAVAERIRTAVAELGLRHPQSQVSAYVTLSMGVATLYPTATLDPAAVIEAADIALYEAKRGGRDRVAVSTKCCC